VQLYGVGRSLREIAWLLNLSEKTVEFHKHHIMESFNLNSNAALVVFAVKRDLIYEFTANHVPSRHLCIFRSLTSKSVGSIARTDAVHS
jgi:hypothetical protein